MRELTHWDVAGMLLPHSDTLKIGKDRFIGVPGSAMEDLWYVRDGEVWAYLEDDESEAVLGVYGRDSFFNIDGLFARGALSPKNVARTQVEVHRLSYRAFDRLLASSLSPYALGIIKVLSANIVHSKLDMSQRVVNLVAKPTKDRVLAAYRDLAKKVGIRVTGGYRLTVPQAAIGRMVGCSREIVGITLRELVAEGLLKQKRTSVIVPD